MKTISSLLSLHKTFEKDENGLSQLTVYLYDGKKVRKQSKEQLYKFLESVELGTVIRMTAVNALDSLLNALEDRGVVVESANWHDLGIEKGLEPEAIVKAFYESTVPFRRFLYNAPLADLRNTLAMRDASMQALGDMSRRLQQIGRNMGLATKEEMMEDDTLGECFLRMEDSISKCIVGINEKGKPIGLDTKLNNQAKKIPLCTLFNKVAGLKDSYVTAAIVMSIIQDIDRFPSVAHLWSYFGQSVIDGHAPKRAKGQPSNWSPAGRKALYSLGDSIIKNRKNPWRQYYDDAKLFYTEKNEAAEVKISPLHIDFRARRKMVKEIMKRFYLAAKGIEFSDHQGVENQRIHVTKGAAAGK